MPEGTFRIAEVSPDMAGFAALRSASEIEGFLMVMRLAEGWKSGNETYSRAGEALFGAWRLGEFVGICGRSIDPYTGRRQTGRVRHLYVHPDNRRAGIGRALFAAVLDGADEFFDRLRLRAPEHAFPFYERLGFHRVDEDSATHVLALAGRTDRMQKER